MNNTTRRPLRVFEAFAGIGAQASALKRMNIDYEIVGRSACAIVGEFVLRRYSDISSIKASSNAIGSEIPAAACAPRSAFLINFLNNVKKSK